MRRGVCFRLTRTPQMEGDANDRSWELLQVVASRERARPVLRKTPGYAGGYLFVQKIHCADVILFIRLRSIKVQIRKYMTKVSKRKYIWDPDKLLSGINIRGRQISGPGEVTTHCPRFRPPGTAEKSAAYAALNNTAHNSFHMKRIFIGNNGVIFRVFRL